MKNDVLGQSILSSHALKDSIDKVTLGISGRPNAIGKLGYLFLFQATDEGKMKPGNEVAEVSRTARSLLEK